MECRANCGACCIAPSIKASLPGMPEGKPAGTVCLHLDSNYRCGLFGKPERPALCNQFHPDESICGDSRTEALQLLRWLEAKTMPDHLNKPKCE